jgi:hypothetical protein
MTLKYVILAGMVLGMNSAATVAGASTAAEAPLCLQSNQEEFASCLNSLVVADQLPKSQQEFQSMVGRLIQGYELQPSSIQKSFIDAFSASNGIPAIEVGSKNYEAEGEEFAPAWIFKKQKAAYIENNIRRTMNFAAWYHARSFGRTSSMLFSFRRIEIQALSTPNIGMALKDKTLLVSLPQNRHITEKELIDFWNSGRVLVPSKYAELPMSWIQFLAKFGDQGMLGQKVLEYWKFLNPVGEFRVGLHALYIARIVEAKQFIEQDNLTVAEKMRLVSFLDNPVETAKSLDSLFSFGNTDSKKGVVVVNRTTGFCPIKVSNSHVINVSVKASRFEGAQEAPAKLTVTTENGKTVVESDKSTPVHIVNDTTYAGLVCVDTHDNVDVSLDVVFGQLDQALTPEKLVNYAKSFVL